jgi:hypothetical protein
LHPEVFSTVLEEVPLDWLSGSTRQVYVDVLSRRLSASEIFMEEAIRARAEIL